MDKRDTGSLVLDFNHNEPTCLPSPISESQSISPREDIACQTTESLPHVISDGKLLSGYYPRFSPIHADFLKAKSLEVFLHDNNIPLSNGMAIAVNESPIVQSIGSALEVICEESERSPPWSAANSHNPTMPLPTRGDTDAVDGGEKKKEKDESDFKHIDSEDDDDDDANTLDSNFTLSIESIETAYYSISRASSYQTSLDYLSSEWNITDALQRQIFIADI